MTLVLSPTPLPHLPSLPRLAWTLPTSGLSGELGTNREGGTTEGRGLGGRGLWDYKFRKGCSTLRTGSPRIH